MTGIQMLAVGLYAFGVLTMILGAVFPVVVFDGKVTRKDAWSDRGKVLIIGFILTGFADRLFVM